MEESLNVMNLWDKIKKLFDGNQGLPKVLSILLFAGLATALLVIVRAAGPYVAAEGEQGTATGVIIGNDANASGGQYIEFTGVSPPSGGVTSLVYADAYNTGGENVGFHDTTTTNLGSGTCRNDAVDLKPGSDDHCNVGWFATSEWLKYDVSIATAGTYTITFNVAKGDAGTGKLHLEQGTTNITGNVDVPSNGDWNQFITLTDTVTLAAGDHTLRLVSDLQYFDIASMQFNGPGAVTMNQDTPPPPPPPPPPTSTSDYGAGVTGASLAIPSGAVSVSPSNIVAEINSKPAGTAFALAAGTYNLGDLPNKIGNRYYGNPSNHLAVVFDGGTVYSGTKPTSGKMRVFTLLNNNIVANLTIKRYRGDDTKGSAPLTGSGVGVTIRNVEVYENQFTGIRFGGSNWDVSYVTSRQNGQYCYGGSGTGHNLSYFVAKECGNAGLPVPRYSEGDRGGSKFVQTTNFTVEYGEVANMDDNGLWFDIANVNVVIRNLWVHDVEQHGIDIEASFGPGLIENNLVEDSAFENIDVAYRRACIFTAMTEDVTIKNNTVRGCKNGIMGYQWNHPQWLGTIAGKVQATPVRNLLVTGNTISEITNNWAGIASLTSAAGCDANAACANNQFVNNTYLGSNPMFWWDDATRNLSYWTSQGLD